jgi:hypothetical protein
MAMKCPDQECDGTVTTTIDDATSGRATESCDGCSYVCHIPGNGQPTGRLKVRLRDVDGAMWLAGLNGFSLGLAFALAMFVMRAKGCL